LFGRDDTAPTDIVARSRYAAPVAHGTSVATGTDRFGTIVFSTFAGIYFWFPKMTGRMLNERLGRFYFWLTFVGFPTTFLVQHWLGAEGMPRRYADYLPADGFTTLNTISTLGAFVLGASTIPFMWNVVTSYRYGEPSWWTTPGDTATHWSGRPRVHRRGTTSTPRPESVPSVPRSSCTTPTWSPRMREEAHVMSAFGGHGMASPSERMANSTEPDETSGRDPKSR